MKSTSHAEIAALPVDKNDRSIKTENKFKIFLTKLSRSKTGSVGLVIVLALFVMAVFAPWIAPFDPGKIDTTKMLVPPFWSDGGSITHILGTDNLGRDILSRIIYGSRISLIVGILSVLVAGTIGVVFGLISGYYGGLVDNMIMRLVDAFLSVPTILFCIVFLTVLDPGIPTLIIVIGVTSWVLYARMIRSETLGLREREYVKAARTMGVSDFQIMKRHILPNVTSSIIVISTLSVASTIITESSLSFLGLGIQPPIVSWGIMLSEGKEYVATSWWLATFPGVAITVTVLGIIFFGEWLRDLLDPRSQGTNS